MSRSVQVQVKPTKTVVAPKRASKIPVQNTAQNGVELNKKLAHMAELHNGLEILKSRMSQSKTDLLSYFDKNPDLKRNKYPVGNRFIRYVDRKDTGGMSQKLVIQGLSEYFKMTGESNAENKVAEAMATILAQRVSRIVPSITIAKQGASASSIGDDEEDEN
jgi:hypothetical protein